MLQGKPAIREMLHPEAECAGSVPRASPRAEWPEQRKPGQELGGKAGRWAELDTTCFEDRGGGGRVAFRLKFKTLCFANFRTRSCLPTEAVGCGCGDQRWAGGTGAGGGGGLPTLPLRYKHPSPLPHLLPKPPGFTLSLSCSVWKSILLVPSSNETPTLSTQ